MCAEALPERCHRQLLADAFTVRGWPVRHVLDDGCAEHQLPPFARPSGTRILYPGAPRAGSRHEPEERCRRAFMLFAARGASVAAGLIRRTPMARGPPDAA